MICSECGLGLDPDYLSPRTRPQDPNDKKHLSSEDIFFCSQEPGIKPYMEFPTTKPGKSQRQDEQA